MAISRHEAASASGKGILPRLSAKEILNLPEEEFNKVAEDFGAAPEKLRELLTRGNKVKDGSYTAPKPPIPGLDESSKVSREAYQSAASYFDYTLPKYTPEKVRRLYVEADTAVRDAERINSVKEWYWKLRGLYGAAYLAEAMHLFQNYRFEKSKINDLVKVFERKALGKNLLAEREGISLAIEEFKKLAIQCAKTASLKGLYDASTQGKMDTGQRIYLARLLNKARTVAMINNLESYEVNSDPERRMIESIARSIRWRGLYRGTIDNTSGNVERFDMPGDRGTGGQSGYWRSGSRPHRDDNGASGGPNDK